MVFRINSCHIDINLVLEKSVDNAEVTVVLIVRKCLWKSFRGIEFYYFNFV